MSDTQHRVVCEGCADLERQVAALRDELAGMRSRLAEEITTKHIVVVDHDNGLGTRSEILPHSIWVAHAETGNSATLSASRIEADVYVHSDIDFDGVEADAHSVVMTAVSKQATSGADAYVTVDGERLAVPVPPS